MAVFNMTDNMGAAPTGSHDKFAEFVKQVAGEMVSWENSGLWQLSALSPIKDYPLIPGFDDTSAEELRVGAYQARHDSSLMQEYQKSLNEKLSRHRQLRVALHSSTPEALQVLKDVFVVGSNPTSNSTDGSNLFSKPSNSSGFGMSTFGGNTSTAPAGGTLFGGNSTNPATSTSLFGKPAQSAAFGSAPSFGSLATATSTSSSLFGASQQNKPLFGSSGTSAFSITSSNADLNKQSVFGSSNATPSLFGSSTTNQTSVFGGSSNAVGSTSTFGNSISGSTNIFGSAAANPGSSITSRTSVFGSSSGTNQNIFGNANTTNTGSVFGAQPSTNQQPNVFASSDTSVFGSNSSFSSVVNMAVTGTSTSSIFGPPTTSQQSSVFGTNNTASVFGEPPAPVNTNNNNNQQTSIFGNSTSQQMSIFGSSSMATVPDQHKQQASIGDVNAGGSLFGGVAHSSVTVANNLFGGNTITTQTSMFAGQESSGSSSSVPLFGSSSTKKLTPADPNDERYTPIDKLSEADKLQYQSDKFLYIPLKPPPRELCFC